MSLRSGGIRSGVTALLVLAAAGLGLTHAHAADLAHLRALAGQYANIVLADPALDAELHSILGDDYADFMSVMQVVLPTTIIDGRFLVAEGCRAHDCGNQGGVVVIDLSKGRVMAARRGLYGLLFDTTPALEAFLGEWKGQ